jgi:hypothetical protein
MIVLACRFYGYSVLEEGTEGMVEEAVETFSP